MRIWLDSLMEHPSQDLVANAYARIESVQWGEQVAPVAVVDRQIAHNSYVCSQYSALLTYASHYLQNQRAATLVSEMAGQLLRWGRVDRAASVNNWLLSTPHHPASSYGELHRNALQSYPDHAIVLKGLNERANAGLLRELRGLGYKLLPSRAVFLFDGMGRHRDLRRDLALLEQDGWTVGQNDIESHEVARVQHLYRMLFLEKHNPNNPDITGRLMDLWRDDSSIDYFSLRRDGQMDGVMALCTKDGMMSVPVVGYDTTISQSAGLYRRLTALAMRHASQRELLLNLSAGASEFKRNRGGVATLDYTAVYCDHLPKARTLVWRGLSKLLQKYWGPHLRLTEGAI